MKKKINSNGSINNLHSLLTKGMTTIKDLHNMADLLGFKIDWIGFGDDFKESNGKLQILNLGSWKNQSHWVAVNTESKEYMDPLSAPPDNYIPKDYKHYDLPIQNMNWGRCGQYVCLFLYYSNRGETDEFFDLFKIGYNE
jgi:hypothetical protein